MAKRNTTNVNIPEEPQLEDELRDATEINEEDYSVEYEDNGEIEKATSKFRMSPKMMLGAIIGVAVIILLVLFKDILPLPEFKASGDEETVEKVKEENKGGFLSGLLNSYDESAEEVKEEGSEEDSGDYVEQMIMDLQKDFPDYEITRDDEKKLITALGQFEGQNHRLVLDYDQNIVEDIVGGDAVATPQDSLPDSTSSQQGTTTPADPANEMVSVKPEVYKRSLISKKAQTLVVPQTTEESENTFSTDVITTIERVIVKFERLPIQGGFTTVYGVATDTGEEFIFPVTLEQYATLANTGTTIIEVTRAEGYGVKTINAVRLVDWKE